MVTTKTYTFSNVTGNHTISAEFEVDSMSILVKGDSNAAGHATIQYKLGSSGTWTSITNVTTAGTTISVASGTNVYFRVININSSYRFRYWKYIENSSEVTSYLDGNDDTDPFLVNSSTITQVTLYLQENTSYTITATAGAGGTISPSGSVSVYEGQSKSFTVTANSGYHILRILVDGSPIQL